MKIILSRKGFDTTSGKMPSPIMPDGTLLSMPIPVEKDGVRYDEMAWHGMTYADILHQLNGKFSEVYGHLDPDIREYVRIRPISGWAPAFGQIDRAQGVLRNNGVDKDDLFLYFGYFQQTEFTNEGMLKYKRSAPRLQVIYGYMQVQEVLTDPTRIASYSWHPHACEVYLKSRTNALYISRKTLTFAPDLAGYDVLDYRSDRVLTMAGKSPATWKVQQFYSPDAIYAKRKNSAKGDGLFYKGVWQELVLHESEEANEWAMSIIR